jgi:diguanylate cyclase
VRTTEAWPPLIRRPQAQPVLHRWLYRAVTFAAWLGWLWLFHPLAEVAALGAGLQTAWLRSDLAPRDLTPQALGLLALLALTSATLIVAWGELDRRRYARRPARHVKRHRQLRSLSEGMQLKLHDVHRLRDARRALVNFTPDGRIVRVDGMDRPGPTRRKAMDDVLSRLAETVTGADSLEGLTRPLLGILQTMTGYESVYLTTIDARAGLQHVLYSHNVARLTIPEALAVPWHDTLCKRALEEGNPCTLDVAQRWPDSQAAAQLGLRSYVSTPVNADGALYGTLCAASIESLPLDRPAQQLLAMFAKLIGQQVERETLLARLKRAQPAFDGEARTDPLTGLANRRALLAELSRMLARAQREGTCVQVALADLDGLAAINARHGHARGDALLEAAAARLASVLRVEDFAARYGGDEFVVLAAANAEEGAENLRLRVSEALAGRYDLDGFVLDFAGASVGAITAHPNEHADAVIARADEAMYADKSVRRGEI